MTTPFKEYALKEFETLDLYSKTVAKVHGKNHPELAEVRNLFVKIDGKNKTAGNSNPDLTAEFRQLREVTGNYKVPADGCETYQATYDMLKTADQAYNK